MAGNNSAVFSSWKEIAAYLGKGVRTVQRWERDLSLPIRRPVAHNQRIVIAVPAELDAWIQQQVARNSAAQQSLAIRDDALRARLTRLTETIHRLDGKIRHLQLVAEQLRNERRRAIKLREALGRTRLLVAETRERKRTSG